MYCPSCGTFNDKNARTCSDCQKPLPVLDEENKKPGEAVRPDAPPPPANWPQPRPFYPGQPGSEYSYAVPSVQATYAPNPYVPAYNYSLPSDRVGVAQVDATFFNRLGAYIIDSIITSLIAGIVLGIPMIIWAANFFSRNSVELNATCGRSYNKIQCDDTIQRILVDRGEIWSFIGISVGFGILASILTLAYYVVLTASGATLGKKVFGLKVVKADGSTPGFGSALLRHTIGYFVSGLFCMLGFIWIIFDPHHQGWHDKIAGTYVVRAG